MDCPLTANDRNNLRNTLELEFNYVYIYGPYIYVKHYTLYSLVTTPLPGKEIELFKPTHTYPEIRRFIRSTFLTYIESIDISI